MVRLRRLADGIAAPAQSRLLWFALGCAALASAELYALFLLRHGTPRSTLGSERFLAGEIAESRTVGQTMRLGANGFREVTIQAKSFHERVEGTVVFTIVEMAPEGARPLYRIVRPAAEVVRAGAYAVSFPPVDASRGRMYRFDVRMPSTRSGGGLGVWANRSERYPDGALFIDGREQWGDLAFETRASSDTTFHQLEHGLRGKPSWVGSRLLLALAFATYNGALGAFLYYLVFAGDDIRPAREC